MSAEAAIARRSFKQVWIGATVWALAFGATTASSALAYVSTFPTEAERQRIAASMHGQTGLAVVFGSMEGIGTVGGYTVYKTFVFLTTIGALWGLLIATRLLRGEEDAGRWQLVLSGSTRAGRATAAVLAALGAAVGIVLVGTFVIVAAAGRRPTVGFGVGETLLYALSQVIAPAVFVGVGAVTSQLCRTRRMATGVGMAVFGAAFVVRMVSDSGASARWLRWLSPFGWVELVDPFGTLDVRPVVVASLVVAALCLGAVLGATRRDVGDGILASRDTAELRPYGLRSSLGLTLRLDAAVLTAWCVGALLTGMSLGLVARVADQSIPSSMTEMLQRFGTRGAFIDQYLGIAFLLVATVVALIPAGQLGAASDEETSGRLVHLLSGSVRRREWIGGRLGVAAGGVVLAALLAGVGTWLGAWSQGVSLGPARMVGAGLNVVPTALLALGIGAVVLALAPRAAAASVYVVIIGSILIDLVAGMVDGLSWMGHASVFHYMALAPGSPVDPVAIVVTLLASVLLCALAIVLFDRRDLRLD